MERKTIDARWTNWTTLLWTQGGDNISIDRENLLSVIENIDFVGVTSEINIRINGQFRHGNKVIFKNCTFKHSRSPNKLSIRIENYYEASFSFLNCEIDSIHVNNVLGVNLKDGSIESLYTNSVNNFHLDFTKLKAITAEGVNFNSLSFLKDNPVERINLTDSRVPEKCFAEITVGELEISKPRVKNLFLKSLIIKGAVSLIECKLDKLSVHRLSGASLAINDSEISEIILYRNSSDIHLVRNSIGSGKVSSNYDCQILLGTNTISKPLIINKQRNALLDFDDQEINFINISENTGDLKFNKIQCIDLQNLESNTFNQVKFTNCQIDREVWDLKLNCTHLDFDDNQLYSLKVETTSITNLKFNNNHIDSLHVNCKQAELISINNSQYSYLILNNSEIQTLELVDGSVERISIQECSIENFTQNETKILNHEINQSQLKNSRLKNHNSLLKSLKINETTIEYLDIDYSRVGDIHVELFKTEKAQIQIPELTKGTFFEIHSSGQSISIGMNDNTSSIYLVHLPKESLEINHCTFREIEIIGNNESGKTPLLLALLGNKVEKLKLIELNSFNISLIEGSYNTIYSNDDKELEAANESESDLSILEVNFKTFYCNSLSQTISLSQCVFEEIEFDSSVKGSIKISNCTASESVLGTKLLFNHTKPRKVEVKSIKCDSLELREALIDDFRCKEIEIKNLVLESIYPTLQAKTFQFNHLNEKKGIKAHKIVIHDSDLSHVNFNSCYFKTFDFLDIKSSKLDKITCTGTNWPKRVISSRKENNSFEVREACRQLKLSMSNHQDKANELHFHSLEMKAYRKTIKEGTTRGQSWNDKFALWGGATNDFGMNWSKPLILLFISVNIAFGLMVTSETKSVPFSYDWNCASHLSDYFTLYNPAHRLDHLTFGKEANGTIATIDFLIRVLSAFFIYQLVAAFRKFRR